MSVRASLKDVGSRLSANITKLYENFNEEGKEDVRELRIQLLGASAVGNYTFT